MVRREAKVLAAPTTEEREKARVAAQALRQAIADPASMGAPITVHIDLSRPRRGEWWTTWRALPGFMRIRGRDGARYHHDCLPGWDYARAEITTEMIPDLEALAAHGVRPTEATR